MLKANLKTWILSSLILSAAASAMSAKISIADFAIEPGKEISVEVSLDTGGNGTFTYSGWQFDLFVPEGISAEGFGLDKALSDQDFRLNMTDYGNGIYRVLAFTTGTGFASENLMSLSFRADENAAPGERTILIQGVVFSAPDGEDIDLDNSEAKVTVKAKEEPESPYGVAETPLQLLRKGDGTSHTFICMMPLTNEQLAQSGYAFVYGYTADAANGPQVIEDTPLRYCHTPAEIFDDALLDFWVVAYRTDAEGRLCVSSRRHLDGSVDDDFDPAQIIGTAPQAVINADEGVYSLQGHYLGSDIPTAKGIYIVRSSGKTLKILR